jgi:hypothetical protein
VLALALTTGGELASVGDGETIIVVQNVAVATTNPITKKSTSRVATRLSGAATDAVPATSAPMACQRIWVAASIHGSWSMIVGCDLGIGNLLAR